MTVLTSARRTARSVAVLSISGCPFEHRSIGNHGDDFRPSQEGGGRDDHACSPCGDDGLRTAPCKPKIALPGASLGLSSFHSSRLAYVHPSARNATLTLRPYRDPGPGIAELST